MPAKKRMSDEDKKKAYEDYMKGEEYGIIYAFIRSRKDLEPIETSVEDVSDDRKQYLELLFKLVQIMKIRSKSKSYDQKYFRTIFFTKNQEKEIDGTKYVLSNDTKVSIWNSKNAVAGIEIVLDMESMDTTLTQDTMNSWRKDLIKALKDFDKMYTAHVKPSTKSKLYSHDEMAGYHKQAMNPLTEVMESNYNLTKLEALMKKDPSLPQFRFKALEERFVVDFTNFNDVIKQFGKLEDLYDVRQELETLKIKDWRNIPPLEYYLAPLANKLHAVRTELLKMRELGPDRCKYILEDNTELQTRIIDMVAQDNVVQWLAGNPLKQDQFKFIYNVGDIIFKSALKDNFLSKEKDQYERVIHDVWPKLVAYKTLLQMRDIKMRKDFDAGKIREKQERARLNGDEDEEETKDSVIINQA